MTSDKLDPGSLQSLTHGLWVGIPGIPLMANITQIILLWLLASFNQESIVINGSNPSQNS